MSLLWLWALTATSTCPAPTGDVLLVVTSADPQLRRQAPSIARHIRRTIDDRLSLLPASSALTAMTAEGGAAERAKTVIQARLRLNVAVERFRELEDTAALDAISDVIVRLSAVSQSPDAIGLLAEAHLLAGAVFLARNRIDAATARLRRALALQPNIKAPATRYAPRVRAELAALRGDPGTPAVLSVDVEPPEPNASVFVDGRLRGTTPIVLTNLPMGRHLVRVSAPGRLSFHTSVRLGERARRVTAQLPIDPEVQQLTDVAQWLGSEKSRMQTLELLARRAEAQAVLLAELRLAEKRSLTATATLAVVLRLSNSIDERPPQTSALNKTALRNKVDALIKCAPATLPFAVAPPLADWPTPATSVKAMTEPPGWWTRPWVWAVFALIAIGGAGAVAASRNADGPPDEVEITLIPRP
ncbi:MAG: PEGA domain-containing protein [Myxococcota bacterium]